MTEPPATQLPGPAAEDADAGVPDPEGAGAAGTGVAGAGVAGAGARPVRVRPHPDGGRSAELDPEDWATTSGSADDRILRERPPHW